MGFLIEFCRLGSARAVNRRYISDCVPPRIRMQASAAFVSASALGMACGPALAGLLQTNFKVYAFTINQDTLPGWVMAFGWLAYLIWLWISFREPALDLCVEAFHEGYSTSSSTSKLSSDKNGSWVHVQFPICCIMFLHFSTMTYISLFLQDIWSRASMNNCCPMKLIRLLRVKDCLQHLLSGQHLQLFQLTDCSRRQ